MPQGLISSNAVTFIHFSSRLKCPNTFRVTESNYTTRMRVRVSILYLLFIYDLSSNASLACWDWGGSLTLLSVTFGCSPQHRRSAVFLFRQGWAYKNTHQGASGTWHPQSIYSHSRHWLGDSSWPFEVTDNPQVLSRIDSILRLVFCRRVKE